MNAGPFNERLPMRIFSMLWRMSVWLKPKYSFHKELQEKLLMMFFSSENHKLSKQEICDELWPKKPNASDTLYTLIKRIKPIIQMKGNLKIISVRGKDYKLTVND